MKTKLFTLLIMVGIAISACTSNKNADGELDSNRVDTSRKSMDTNTESTNLSDTATKKPDTVPVDHNK